LFKNQLLSFELMEGRMHGDITQAEARIDELDLEPIKYKLVMDREGPLWSRERADVAASRYKKFLTLVVRFPREKIVPLGDIDIVWHRHILDTAKYINDCQVIFGRYLHHFPYFGLRGADDEIALHRASENTKRLFADAFGEVDVQELVHSCDSSPEPGPPSCTPEPSCSGEPNPTLSQIRPRFGRHVST
jgi:hypothetical protein